MLTEPAAELFRVASLPECEREPGGGVDQEGAVGAAVECEVVDAQHSGRDQWRQRHPHQLEQDGYPREPDVQDPKHPGSAPASQHHAHVLHQACNRGVRR
ncbi:hypothetical protein GCM10010326_77650 [Streptomyces xanthochromogenes]|uniref:Uncharacterized protein n=1 Tax=Streptomyces xanthochromogenes TaxID=67384 RepID=A0ABQ3AZN9_9ACTN|nr:hypothetical protein GCM10010326_77650 [Streptomyces xanthochromogenes]